jgi:hypothetical protein
MNLGWKISANLGRHRRMGSDRVMALGDHARFPARPRGDRNKRCGLVERPTAATRATNKKAPADGQGVTNDPTHLSHITRLITCVELRVSWFKTSFIGESRHRS